jgi:hypothetical protein
VGGKKVINKVKKNIEDKLKKLYKTYNIYLEDKQSDEILKPALKIKVDNKTTNYQREKSIIKIKFDIVCLLDNDNKNELYWDISDKLDEELEILNLEGTLVRTGEKISEISEGQLHYRFDTTLNLVKEKQQGNNISSIVKEIKVI